MTRDEFEQYWRPARDNPYFLERYPVTLRINQVKRAICLAGLLGEKYREGGDWELIVFTPKVRDALIKLGSPYGYAIAKAMEARNDEFAE